MTKEEYLKKYWWKNQTGNSLTPLQQKIFEKFWVIPKTVDELSEEQRVAIQWVETPSQFYNRPEFQVKQPQSQPAPVLPQW